jgi:hypothetical protein
MNLSIRLTGVPVRGLEGCRIAVSEARPVVKIAIVSALRRSGATIGSLSADTIDAAALALGLGYESVAGPIVDDLQRRNIPFLLYMADAEIDVLGARLRWRDKMILERPGSAEAIVSSLAWLLTSQASDRPAIAPAL